MVIPVEGLLQGVRNFREMLKAAGRQGGAAAAGYVGCGGTQPPLPAGLEVPQALYVVAA